jgi:surfeit locus 1 family protein
LPALAAIVVVALCVAAGNWQGRRMRAKEALRAEFDAASQMEPLPIASLAGTTEWTSLRYRPVVATGEYVGRWQILIDNKVHAGRAGFHVITPLALEGGRYVLVDRGWISQGASRADLPKAPPPAGLVTVRGRIALPSTRYLELKAEAPTGPVWQNLDLARYTAATELAVLPVLIEETAHAPLDDGIVRDWPPPDFGIDTHRIYMMQWYAFALVAAALWLWFARPWRRGDGDG